MITSFSAQSGISLGWMLVICDGPMRSLQPTRQSARSCSSWVMLSSAQTISCRVNIVSYRSRGTAPNLPNNGHTRLIPHWRSLIQAVSSCQHLFLQTTAQFGECGLLRSEEAALFWYTLFRFSYSRHINAVLNPFDLFPDLPDRKSTRL